MVEGENTMSETTLDDRFTGLAPDTVLPDQFFGAMRQNAQLDGERRLMIAVLEDAVNVYLKQVLATDPKARQLFVDAEEWIMADDPTWFFSSTNVCNTLDLDAGYIRTGLRRWKERKVAEQAAGQLAVRQEVERDAVKRSNASGADGEDETVLLKASGA
jgi:hypothetical protein